MAITYNHQYGKEMIYVLGGHDVDVSPFVLNDVYISSDYGMSFQLITRNAEWPIREGFVCLITESGMMIVQGGSGYTADGTLSDVWVSFNGGYHWFELIPTRRDNAPRQQSAALLDQEEFLYVLGGESSGGVPLSDVYRSSFSFSDTVRILQVLSLPLSTAEAGIGLLCYPGDPSCSASSRYLQLIRMTEQAPWSTRVQAAFQTLNTDLVYTEWNTGNRVTAPAASSLLLYGGSAPLQDDVWLTTSPGRTWQLISGIARTRRGAITTISAFPYASYKARYAGSVCEDPSNDRAYEMLGYYQKSDGSYDAYANDVFVTEDGITWTNVLNSSSPFPYNRY